MKFELFLPRKFQKREGFVHENFSRDFDFKMLQPLTLEHSLSISLSPNIQVYKRSLLIKLIFGFVLFLCFILERSFQYTLKKRELSLIVEIQELWFGENAILSISGGGFFYLVGKIGEFHVFFLLMTHLIATLYVGVDAMIALKTVTVSLMSVFLLAMLSFINGEPRPFWMNSHIKAFYCDASYSDPGIVTFLFLFLILYCYRCFSQKGEELLATMPLERSFDEEDSPGFLERQKKWFNVIFLVITLTTYFSILFIRFLIGLEFLTNYFLSFILFCVIYSIVVSTDSFLEEQIKQSTILKLYAKRKIFIWLIFFFVIEGLACIFYRQASEPMKLLFIQNYFGCQRHYHQEVATHKLFQDVIGKKETFQATAVLFALTGLFFGAAHTFRTISSINWYKGPFKLRFFRALIANIAILPSWALITFQEDLIAYSAENFLGISNLLLDSVHYFLLYYGIFGIIPVYIYLSCGLAFVDLRFSMVLTH